jgi:protein SCO1/2
MTGQHKSAPTRSPTLTVAALGAVLGALVAFAVLPDARNRLFGPPGPIVTGTAQIGGPFVLQDTRGNRVTDQALLGHYSLIFFGYTRSPDVTPAALQVLSNARAMLGPKAARVRGVFVTIDPVHDTPDVMTAFLSRSGLELLGLTGLPPDIDAMMRAYHVNARAINPAPAEGSERFAYAPIFYLMGPDGRYITHFDDVTDARQLAGELKKLL